MAAMAVGLIALWVSFATGAETAHGPGGDWILVLGALVPLAIALGLLRVSIRHGPPGLGRHEPVASSCHPWSNLEDVILVEVEAPIQFGLHQLALVTRDGTRVTTAATGLVKPGCRLERLQRDLVAMQDRYGSTSGAP